MSVERKRPASTIVADSEPVTEAEMAVRVMETREQHGPLLQQFHEAWYQAPHTWHYTHFLGVGLMKAATDLWMYQQLITEYRPQTIIETGTYKGGSALWYAYLMDMLRIEDGQVFTIDIDDHRQCNHGRITFLEGDSTDPLLRDAIAAHVKGPVLISLDADHSRDHVKDELELYAPLVGVGDWLIVEDTNISWVGDDPTQGERGARGGLEDYLKEHPGEFLQDVLCERWLLTMHPGGWLRRVAPCSHG